MYLRLLGKLLISLAFMASVQALAEEVKNDIAIDPGSKETFVLSKVNNPSGEVLIVNGDAKEASKVLKISERADDKAIYEIELTRSGQLAYLASTQKGWRIGRFQKSESGEWVKTGNEISGSGPAWNLAAIPDGNILVSVPAGYLSYESDVLLVKNGSLLRTVERIDSKKIAQADATYMGNVAKVAGKLDLGDEDYLSGATGNAFGLTAGLLTGLGLSYRRFITDKHGVQLGGIAFGDSDSIHANVGIEYLHTIHDTERARLYWLAGVSTYYNKQKEFYAEPTDPSDPNKPYTTTSRTRKEHLYNFGAGLGIEAKFGQIGVALELPVTASWKDEDNGKGVEFDSIYPVPNLSVHYYIPKSK